MFRTSIFNNIDKKLNTYEAAKFVVNVIYIYGKSWYIMLHEMLCLICNSIILTNI